MVAPDEHQANATPAMMQKIAIVQQAWLTIFSVIRVPSGS
jgi:hypothetical protein